MSKVTLNNLSNLENENTAVSLINSNNSTITTAFDNTLSRDGTSPNTMGASLDMNNNQILNLPSPATVNSPARIVDVVSNPTLVVPPTGTSGHVVPFLDGNNIFSGTDTFGTTTTTTANITTANITTASITAGSITTATIPNITGPTIISTVTVTPVIAGGSATNSSLVLESTSNVSPSGDVIQLKAHGTSVLVGFNGNVGLGTETSPAAKVVLSSNNGAGITPFSGTNFFMLGADASTTVLTLSGAVNAGGTMNSILATGSRGTAASPSNLSSGDVLLQFGGVPYVNGAFAGATTARFRIVYNDTSPNLGTFIEVDTTPAGSTTRAQCARFMAGMIVGMGTSDPGANNLSVGGTIASTGSVGIGTAVLSSSWTAIAAGTTALSQINFAASTAPTSPNNGDFWFDGTNFKARVGGATKTFTIS